MQPLLINSRILVVDDITKNLQVVGTVLRNQGYKVMAAASGAEALKCVRTQLPDLILLDLMMPEMDGFQFVEALRKNPGAENIPVIVVTAKTLSPSDHLRLNGQVTDILRKGTLDRGALLAQIRSMVKSPS